MDNEQYIANEKKPLILIVDDVPKNLQVLGSILGQEEYEIVAAVNGKNALTAIEEDMPDLILLDVMMPEMDGFEVCKRLKNSDKTKDIPIIFLTAKKEIDDVVKGFELGAADYVTKPFNSNELLKRVNTHLELKLTADNLRKSNESRKSLLHVMCHDLVNPLSFIKGILELSQHDPSILTRMLPKMEITVNNGIEIIELVRKMRALEEAKLLLDLDVTDFKHVLNHSSIMLDQKFTGKNIQLELNIADNLSVYVEKISFINSVLNNILTNAIKFSYPDSKIIINAKREGSYSVITIRDFGIGMPERLINDVFDISKATSRQGTNGEPGTGFGMPLLKKFVTAYGGTVEISSKEKSENSDDHGTEIKLTLRSDV